MVLLKFSYLSCLLLAVGAALLFTACQSRTITTVPYRFIDYYKPSIEQLAQKKKTEIVQSFKFDNNNDLEGWIPANDIKDVEVKNGILRMRATGIDPYMIKPINIDSSRITAIFIRMKVSMGNMAYLYWKNDQFPTFSLKTAYLLEFIPDDKFHDYYIFVEDIANWTGRLKILRLDPTNEESVIEIDEILLLNIPFIRRILIEKDIKKLTKGAINNESRNIILAFPPHKVSQKVNVPEDAVFCFGYGVLKNAWGGEGDGVQFYVKAVDKKGKEHILFSDYIDPKHYKTHRRWFDHSIDLSQFKGQEIALVLETQGSYPPKEPYNRPPDLRYDYAVWSNPTVYSPGYNDKRPNIILIVLDTLRADALSCYGNFRKTSPHIDELAERPQSVIFKNAFSTSPWTTPSHASLFTSKHLWLDVDVEGKYLPENETTLAEVLYESGYNTAAFTGGVWVTHQLGFDKGFNIYSDTSMWGKIEEVYQETINWLEKNRQTRFFLFFHTYETHAPYTRDSFAKDLDYGRIPADHRRHFSSDKKTMRIIETASEKEKQYIRALYDGGVLYADRYLGLLFDKLKEFGLLKNTIIIITSDHGEEFWEHYDIAATHGHSLFNELLHVPLIIYAPVLKVKKKTVEDKASLIDVFPTLLDLAGIEPYDRAKIMGTSLLPLIEGKERQKSNIIFSELKSKVSKIRLQSIITDRYKYIYSLDGEFQATFDVYEIDITSEQLFNLTYDPQERVNLIKLESALVEQAQSDLRAYIKKNKLLLEPDRARKQELKLDEELIKRLKALGYLK
ncbi:MAG: sulfatase [Candidatus Aminicenantes bacterium]|nr:sulfatase [Candidatus Aminicenantes bacterium]